MFLTGDKERNSRGMGWEVNIPANRSVIYATIEKELIHCCWLHPVPWLGGTIQISSAAFVSHRGKIQQRASTRLKFTNYTLEGFRLVAVNHRGIWIHFCFQGQTSLCRAISQIDQIVPPQRRQSLITTVQLSLAGGKQHLKVSDEGDGQTDVHQVGSCRLFTD